MKLFELNRKYDDISNKSERMVVGIAVMMPGIVMISAPVQEYPVVFLAGVVLLTCMLVTRIYYLRSTRKAQ